MSAGVSIDNIIKHAATKGYFAFEDFPGLKLTLPELQKLKERLDRKHLLIKSPLDTLTRRDALSIVEALRTGTVPSDNVTAYTVGRDDLMVQVRRDLDTVASGHSMVRFVNADYGHGKTHLLHLLQEIAYVDDFTASTVTLSHSECPLYRFGEVYNKIMWGIRTKDQRKRPALDNILDRWLEAMRFRQRREVERVVAGLPEDMKNALVAYYEADNPISPRKEDQLAILKWLSGESGIYLADIRRKYRIQSRVDEHTALNMLGLMASLFRHLGYQGICILFDEAEAIDSISQSSYREQACANLRMVIERAKNISHCYFVYATTPSFFDSYHFLDIADWIEKQDILQLTPLSPDELDTLVQRILSIYQLAVDWSPRDGLSHQLRRLARAGASQRVGDFIRALIAFFDEKRALSNG